jgi:hypothetical protein
MDKINLTQKNMYKKDTMGILNGLKQGIEAFDMLLSADSKKWPSNINADRKSPGKSKQEEHYTFDNQRLCLNCRKPIPDQFNLKRNYCKKIRDANGTLINNCRGKFNRLKNKPEKDMHNAIIKEYKTVDDRIEAMVAKKGNVVSTADLNAYDINLTSPLNYIVHKNGFLESVFMRYKIASNPFNQTHKIEIHE